MAEWMEIKEAESVCELLAHFDPELVEEYVEQVPALANLDVAVLKARLQQVQDKLGADWAGIVEYEAESGEYLFWEHICSSYEDVWAEELAGLKKPLEREWTFAEVLRDEYGAEPDVSIIYELYGYDMLYLLDTWQDELCENAAYLKEIGVEDVGEVVTRWPHIFISFEDGLAPIMEALKEELGDGFVAQLNENMSLYERVFNWGTQED